MGKIPKGSESISKMTDGDAILQYKNLGNGVRGNIYFLTPDVATVAYDAAGVDFEEKAADKPKTLPKTAIKNAARKIINRNYKSQASCVNRICNGNVVMLATTNIIMNKEEGPRANPYFTVENGTLPGDVNFSSKSNKNAHS